MSKTTERAVISYGKSEINLNDVNKSFGSGVLRICYPGANKNQTYISKDVLIKAVPSLYNCPIVCNYDRETDTLGSHDMDIVKTSDGNVRLVNLTVPVGVIPESANVWFESVEEDNGIVHEYLCADALLWKRQEAYKKIAEDGEVAHSMEINIKSTHRESDNCIHIDEFEFTALALIGVSPCFESSSLEVFSSLNFKELMKEMLRDLQGERYALDEVTTPDGSSNKEDAKGGEDMDKEEKVADEEVVEGEETSIPEESATEKFMLADHLSNELHKVTAEVTHTDDDGRERRRYWVVNHDEDTVYCEDDIDGGLYGFPYSVNGDGVVVDFTCKKRKKYAIVDFNDGEEDPIAVARAKIFESSRAVYDELDAMKSQFANAQSEISTMKAELEDLRAFKANVDTENAKAERQVVLDKFADLEANSDFEALKEHCMDYATDVLEEKCYAIRGRIGAANTYSANSVSPKLPVFHEEVGTDGPYGDLFNTYL